MISVDEALALVHQHARRLEPVVVPVEEATGLVLAEPVVSDTDSPPYTKALMDGFAVRAADVAKGARLRITEQVTAGEVGQQPIQAGTAAKIMTGAPIPAGADAVVMIEQTTAGDRDDEVVFVTSAAKAGQNILPRAACMSEGEQVLSPGHRLRAVDIGLMCEVGHTQPRVMPRPVVAVLATGNELVPPDQVPQAGQIRNSNGAMVAALAERAGATVENLGIARDDRDALRTLIQRGLDADFLVLSGGVSAGVLDLVPATLQEAGVVQVFHKVHLKPGKPLWFGTGSGCQVFGLPGNPVSSLVCFELFVRPAIAWAAGATADDREQSVSLAAAHQHRGNRPTYFPGRLSEGRVETLKWKGSADQRTLAMANCLVEFPAGDHDYQCDERVTVFLL